MKTGEVVDLKSQLIDFKQRLQNKVHCLEVSVKGDPSTYVAIPSDLHRFSVLYCDYLGSHEILNQKCNQEQISRECFQPPLLAKRNTQ